MSAKSTPRRGRPPVPKESIVEAALQILVEEGADALSLRNLASRLSSSTSTLYRHVANRNELIELVFDELLGEVLDEQSATKGAWESQCKYVATRLFDVLSAHKGATGLVEDSVPTGPNALAIREYLLSALVGAGFPLDVSAKAVATIGHYVIGFALQAPASSQLELVGLGVGEIDSAKFPLMAKASPVMPFSLMEEFEFGLDLILAGLSQRIDRTQI